MEFEYAYYTNTGRRRRNEDFLGIQKRPGGLVAAVADGVGGSKNGHIASQMAVDGILSNTADSELEEDALLWAIIQASKNIYNADIEGVTTVAALWLSESEESSVAAHVGDSRIYQFRDQQILYQSIDHSNVQMAILVGELGPDAIRNHKSRNIIYRVLGDEREPKADSTELDICPGDRFLLCTDGFWEPVLERDMLQTMENTTTAAQWLQAMVQIVEDAKNPTQDNYTAVCIVVQDK